MQKIINQLGTAQYNPFRNSIEVRFKNFGELNAYQETLDLSISIASTLKVKRWLLVKYTFGDIDPAQFIQILKLWMFKHRKKLEKNKFSILTRTSEKKQIQNLLEMSHLPVSTYSNETVAYQSLEDSAAHLANK